MRIPVTARLFAWDQLDDCPDLVTVREFLALFPDAELLASLRGARGRGRNDYPVHVCWGCFLLTIGLRHTTIEACLAELRRNPALRELIGIESNDAVPEKWNMSRFLRLLGAEPHLTHLTGMFDVMARRLADAVPDLGRNTAGDATALSARPSRSKKSNPDGLPIASGGRKEYTDAAGKVTKIVEWFGYKLHLLVDVKHEVILAYKATSTKAGDGETLPALVDQANANLGPRSPGSTKPRIETLAYDKAADSEAVHEKLDAAGIKPLVEIRSLWKGEHERMLPGHDGTSNIVYDEAGTVYCYDKVSRVPVRQKMAFIGHEPARGTLKYRCPARHSGCSCPSDERCNRGLKYGKTVRVNREINLRRFPPIPRATKKFERLYKGRTAVERVNARVKIFWGADDGNVTGPERFFAHVSTVMVVHLAFATLLARAPRREGTLSRTRLSPIAQALRKKPATPGKT